MKVMRLEIEQQRAQIDIDIQNARLHVNMPKQRMEINQERPEMTVNYENPDVELDMDAFKANIGLKNYDQLTAEAAANAKATAQQGVKEIVSRSNYIGDVTIPGNKVAAAAKDKMLEVKAPQMGRSPVPPGIDMYGKPGTVEIEFSDYELSIDWVGENKPEIYVEPPSSVDVELSTQPDVKISVQEVYIPASSGRNLNTEV